MPRTTPAFLRALGRNDPPPSFEMGGNVYTHLQTFKHDFFAATAVYEGSGSRVVLKLGRQAWLGPIPLRWVGRVLAWREAAILRQLDDVSAVPRLLGRWGATGIVRGYIDGRPLERGLQVPGGFHCELRSAVGELHRRKMAYVDLEKAENVLLGQDGKPYLIDFQIAWYLPPHWGGDLWPARVLCRWLQQGDLYHLTKLKRRTRPDLLSPEELAASYRKPWYVRLHSAVVSPLRWGRRRVLNRLDPRRTAGERGVVEPVRAHDGPAGTYTSGNDRNRLRENTLGGL